MMASILLTAAEADLVRAAGEMCSTCGGSGEVQVDSMSMVGIPGGFMPDRCPDCSGKRPGVVTLTVEGEPECSLGYECDDTTHNGRCGESTPPSRWALDGQRVTLTVECPKCDGTRSTGRGQPCPGCCNGRFGDPTGTVPLATATVRVEPGDGTHWNVVLDEIEVAG